MDTGRDRDPSPTGEASHGAAQPPEPPATHEEKSTRLGDLGEYIRNQRNLAQLSLRNLAKMAGVSNPYLSQIERGLRKPSAEILQAIAKALSISAETLYVKAGILEERDPDDAVENAISRDRYLTEPQRQALVEMYRSFRQLAMMAESGRRDAGAGAAPAEAAATDTATGDSAPADAADDAGEPGVDAS